MSRNSKNDLILSSQKFQRLVSIRNKARFVLSALVIFSHAFFVGGIAFYRDLFATPMSEGSTITLGILFTAIVIFLLLFLEWIYIYISRKVFDPLQKECQMEVKSND